MSYYMTNIVISPTLYEKNKYKDIKLRLNVIAVAIIEAKKRYFDDCSFIKIIL